MHVHNRRTFLASAGAAAVGTLVPSFGSAQNAVAPHRIDVHHHFFPAEYLKVQRAGIIAAADADPSIFFSWTAERALGAMDETGVAFALSSPPLPGVWITGDIPQTRKVTRIYNDGAADVARKHPTRFGNFAALALPDVSGSLTEIEYAFSTLKVDGVSLLSSYDGKWLGDPLFDPVFAELNRRKTTVYVHPTTPACCNNIMPDVLTSNVEFLFDTTRSIVSLLYAGTFTKYPSVKFIFAHTGGTVADLSYRINAYAARHKEIADRNPDGALAAFKKLYYDVANSTNPPAMSAILSLVPLSQILFGSDYPYVQIPVTTGGLDKLNYSAHNVAAINRDNALALFPRLKGVTA